MALVPVSIMAEEGRRCRSTAARPGWALPPAKLGTTPPATSSIRLVTWLMAAVPERSTAGRPPGVMGHQMMLLKRLSRPPLAVTPLTPGTAEKFIAKATVLLITKDRQLLRFTRRSPIW